MTVAAPGDAALRVHLAADDAIDLPADAAVTLFLGVDPLTPVPARLVRFSYAATAQADGTPAYALDARFTREPRPRIGLRGTAKVHGRPVPLFLFLFRRPLAAARQFLGI